MRHDYTDPSKGYVHTDPALRHDFIYLYDIENGNPNGDPDMGNLPRIDHETGHGFVTDGCVKRKIRDWVDVLHGEEEHTQIYVQNRGIALNTLHRRAYEAEKLTPVIEETDDADTASATTVQGKQAKKAQKKKQPKEDIDRVCKWMGKHFYDVRAFGAVMATRINCGQVLGPLQLKFPISVSPIEQCEISITRVAITKEEEDKTTEMGSKQFLPYALYRGHGFYSPFIAQKSGFSASDLALFWEALEWVWDFDRSASRGQQNFQGLYIFTHANPCGNAHAHKLFKRLDIQLSDGITVPRTFEDYMLHLDKENLPEGITLTIIRPDEKIQVVKSEEDVARTIVQQADAIYGEQPGDTYWVYASRHRPISGSGARIPNARYVNSDEQGVYTWVVIPAQLTDELVASYELDLFHGPVELARS